jgi:hypothetical protein
MQDMMQKHQLSIVSPTFVQTFSINLSIELMRKNIFLIACIFMAMANNCFSQNVSITADATPADNSAMLDVKATDKGILIPRITEAARTGISTPAVGLMVYQTDGTKGFYYNEGPGINWKNISTVTNPVRFSAQILTMTVNSVGTTQLSFWSTTTPYFSGLGFNPTTGTFIVPETGIYHLAAAINYRLPAAASTSISAIVDPYFGFLRVSPPFTTLATGMVPILDINTFVLNIRTVLGAATIPIDATVNLTAGDVIQLAYVGNGYNGSLDLGSVTQPGVTWSVIKL